MTTEKPIEHAVDIDDEEQKAVGGEKSMHYGDPGYESFLGNEGGIEDTTWGEVCRTCFCHSAAEWGHIIMYMIGILFFLYWFIFSLELLGTGAKVLTGCAAAGLFGGNTNPVASLVVGILVTVLLQSSSTTTSIIVSLVGAGSLPVEPAIYMVMGANIGTSVTNTIVAMGQMGNGDELERAFAGATVHDMFNFLSVLILFPLEIITHFLARMTQAMTKNYSPGDHEQGGGIKVIISPILDRIIKSNSKVITEVADGGTCDEYYPTYCTPAGQLDYQSCAKDGRVGLITCSKDYGCPAFFMEGATEGSDTISGAIALVMGIILLILCLVGLVTILKKMLLGASTRIIRKATAINGYVSMIIGAGITMAVQSSSVTTSVLTPLVGVGLVSLTQMFPLTLGANIGTTVTSIIAAGVASTSTAMQVALAHFFFNIFGIIIWYPLPFMRKVPLDMARKLGKWTRWWLGFPFLYIAVVFFMLPALLLGLSSLFISSNKALVTLGAMLLIFFVLGFAKFLWWWFKQGGAAQTEANFKKRQAKNDVMKAIADEWKPLKEDIENIKDHLGMVGDKIDDIGKENENLTSTEHIDG